MTSDYLVTKLAMTYPESTRAALAGNDPLMTALGRPNREQVVTTRATVATTLQALEMTNGETLADILKRGDEKLMELKLNRSKLINTVYEKALTRKPTRKEQQMARRLVGDPAKQDGVEDLLWAVVMLPEFQLIY